MWKKAIINTLAASGGNIAIQPAAGALPKLSYICSNDASNHAGTPWAPVGLPTAILPPITGGTVVAVQKTLSAAEVTQIAIFGRATETITASTAYKLKIGTTLEKYEGKIKGIDVYAYTSPAVLSGTSQTDLDNVMTVLVGKVNNRTSNHITAYLMYKVAFTLGTSTGDVALNFSPGDTVTQQTSAATAKVAAVVITAGTLAADNAAGTIYLYNITGTWSAAAKTLTATSTTEICTTNAALVIQGIVVVDDAGYYPAVPSNRKGPSTYFVAGGFTSAVFEVGVSTATTAATVAGRSPVLGVGIGSRLLQDVPQFNADKTDFSTGNPAFVLNDTPDAAKTYTRLDILFTAPVVKEVLDSSVAIVENIWTLWIQEDAGLTNHATFLTALASATGVTIA
jgi:hypothetical protein